MKEKVEIITGFDGAAPYSSKAIKREGETEFTIYPSFTEVEDAISPERRGEAHRLTVKILNTTSHSINVKIKIDHEDSNSKKLAHRTTYFVKHEKEKEWRIVPTPLKDGKSIYEDEIKPGITILAEAPPYNYEDNENFIKRISNSEKVEASLYGKSEKDLNLWMVKISHPKYRDFSKRKVGIVARNHAYETAGNYCVEGMVEFLLSGDEIAEFFLSQYDFYFLPMTNPDGVKYGMSRLTSPKGADLARINTRPDKAHKALKSLFDKEKFDICLHIHNWQNKTCDGIIVCNLKRFAELVDKFWPSYNNQFKIRKIISCQEWLWLIKTWYHYSEELNYGKAIAVELPWYGRKTEDMRKVGKELLLAVIHADIHENTCAI